MADKKAGKKAPDDERDEDERDEDERDEDERDEDERDDEDEADKDAPSSAKSGDGDGDGDGEPDESAARVAEALGIDEEGSTKPAGTEEPVEEAAPNRAARRREEARERRRKRKAAEGGAETSTERKATDDENLPRDKNARAKELLLRRRESAKGGGRAVQSALLPGEMVDDALARTASAFSKWFRGNWNTIQWMIAAAIVVGGGSLFYISQKDKKAGNASSTLASAVQAERGRIMAEDKRTDEEKEVDTNRIFKTPEERADNALAAYTTVAKEYPGTGTAILATMGEAGVFLDKKDYDKALERYNTVIASTLAAADPDVKGRSIEGVALAKEGKGDIDGALKSFKELESIDAKGYKELALYQQARLLFDKGDKDKAKELLKQAREKLSAPGADGHPFQFLEAVVDETLRKIDPTAVPPKNSFNGPKGSQMSPEELEKLIKRARDAQEKKKSENPEQHDDEH